MFKIHDHYRNPLLTGQNLYILLNDCLRWRIQKTLLFLHINMIYSTYFFAIFHQTFVWQRVIACHMSSFLARLAKGFVSFVITCCPSVVRCKLSHLNLLRTRWTKLNQIKPNLAWIVLEGSPFKIMSDSPATPFRMVAILKIEISLIVYCCFITSQHKLKF